MKLPQELLEQINDNSLYHTLGIRVEEAGNGTARSRLEPPPGIYWPSPGQLHGGVLYTMIDTSMAWAVFSQLDPQHTCATVNVDIQYILPARGSLFTCSAQTLHRTGRLSFARAEIRGAKNEPVAMGQGTFRIIEADAGPFGDTLKNK